MTPSAFRVGVDEANRRERGAFDGLLGRLPSETSVLLSDLISELRDTILSIHTETQARMLIERHERFMGSRTETTPDVELALRLMVMIRSALRCEGDQFSKLVFGKAGARDQKRQAGASKGGLSRQEPEWHARCVNYAEKLLQAGKSSRDLTALCSEKFAKDPTSVRRLLKKAGIK